MANVGLKEYWFADLNEDESGYGEMKKLAAAIESKMSLTTTNAELYADDVLNDKVDEFVKAALTLGIDDDDDSIFGPLLGQTSKELSNGTMEYVQKTTDEPKFVGFSQIVTKRVKGKTKHKVEFLKKVKFKPYSTDKKTKKESIEFVTPSVEGTVYPLSNGEWESHATFDSKEDAMEYMKLLFGAESTLTYKVETQAAAQSDEGSTQE